MNSPISNSSPSPESSPRGDITLSEAIRSLRDCAPEVRPCIYKLLCDAGFDLPPLAKGWSSSESAPRSWEDILRDRGPCLDSDRASFANWFREAYRSRNMTGQQIADALHTTRMTIYRWSYGVRFPRDYNLRIILEYFDETPPGNVPDRRPAQKKNAKRRKSNGNQTHR